MSGGRPEYRAVVIGAGFGAEHLRLLRKLPGVEIECLVYGRDRTRAEEVAAAHDVPRVTRDVAEALAGRPDFVVVVTPPDTHAAFCAAALDAGCAVVCDKPLARDGAEAEAIARRSRRVGSPAMVFFQWRFHPAARRLRDLCRAGALGRLVHVQAEFFHDFLAGADVPWSWRCERARCGFGAFGDMGVHLVDLVLWATAEEMDVLEGWGTVLREARSAPGGPRACDAEDYGALSFRLSGGAHGSLVACRSVPGLRTIRLTVVGDAGSAELCLSPDTTAGGLTVTGAAGAAGLPEALLLNPYVDWLARLAGRPVELPGMGDGVRAQRVLDAMAREMNGGRRAAGGGG